MTTKRYLTLISLAFFITVLTSCETLFFKMYGMKKIKPISAKTILQYSKKYNIPLADSYELDTSFISFIYSIDTLKYKEQCKNHYQPLQALYYDKSGQMQSFHINCYASGFPNLNWGRNSTLTEFPPKLQAPIDSILPLEKQLGYLRPLSSTEKLTTNNYDFFVIVYWDRFMGRQSKRLIHFIQDNCKLAINKKVKIIYVNNDNFFIAVDNRK